MRKANCLMKRTLIIQRSLLKTFQIVQVDDIHSEIFKSEVFVVDHCVLLMTHDFTLLSKSMPCSVKHVYLRQRGPSPLLPAKAHTVCSAAPLIFLTHLQVQKNYVFVWLFAKTLQYCFSHV